MAHWLSLGDFIDVYWKLQISGFRFVTDRWGCTTKSRIKNVWDKSNNPPTNWWAIPEIQKRWNKCISGNPEIDYQTYFCVKYLNKRKNLKLLSPGCGNGQNERKFANFTHFSLIKGFDIAPSLINEAINHSKNSSCKMEFTVDDIMTKIFPESTYDIILFDSFLHHIKDLDSVMDKIFLTLKPGGFLLINEYVGPNRFQWTKDQLLKSNQLLENISNEYKMRWRSSKLKTRIYRPGLLRMILSDPSEAIKSSSILPKIRKRFKPIEESPYGGNLLQLVLKDISHNFSNDTLAIKKTLKILFRSEDNYLDLVNTSDFFFGIYQK